MNFAKYFCILYVVMAMNRIKELRTAHDMKQEDLAERLSVRRQTVSRYEIGQNDLDTETIRRLCEIFGVTADYLLGFSSVPTPVISEEDAELLAAYHAADTKDRKLVDEILEEYKKKKITAAG